MKASLCIAALLLAAWPGHARAGGAGPTDDDGAPAAPAPASTPVRAPSAAMPLPPPAPSEAPGASLPAPQPGSDAASPGDVLSPDDLRDALTEETHVSARDPSEGEPPTGTVRSGVYHDSDQTTVLRLLGVLGQSWTHWNVNASFGVDSVTSASVDVRSSPALSKVDVTTSASGRSSTSGGQMTDTRYQATAGGGWKDNDGHALSVTSAAAIERDYASISGGLNGSYDLMTRQLTLLGGFTLTDNWVSSVLDTTLHRKMFAAGWSGGLAYVVTRNDALRLRYDGKLGDGYMASPYRNVRFGNWSASIGDQQIVFRNTLGSVDGLPELVPNSRVSHAATAEWVHSLGDGVGLHPQVRLQHDTWGIDSLTAALDLRVARKDWRFLAGYRFYMQSAANFFQDKYTMAPATYAFYTSDKELGAETGHQVRIDFAHVLIPAERNGDSKLMLDLQVDGVYYSYPGFTLLPSRESVFAMLGLSWEL